MHAKRYVNNALMKKEQHKVKNKKDDIINGSNKLTSCYVLYVTTDAAQNDKMDVQEHEEKQGSLGKESEQKEKESEEEEKGSEEEKESEQGDLKLSKKRKKKKEKRSTAQRKKSKKRFKLM